jgi:carbamoyltransferase
VGAATYVAHAVLGEERHTMETACLGPGYSDDEIRARLDRLGVPYARLSEEGLPATAASLLASGKIIGWFQGRMEFGPRALGSRSILADPRDGRMKEELNNRIKHREQFRPFAPSVLRETAHELFDFGASDPDPESPFMLLVARVRDEARVRIPAVTHEDGTARVQTVGGDHHPRFHAVIEAFGRLTGTPALINTSFNVRGEPIVRTPEEAFNTFSHTDLDYLLIGDALVPASAKRQLGPYPGITTIGPGTQVVV